MHCGRHLAAGRRRFKAKADACLRIGVTHNRLCVGRRLVAPANPVQDRLRLEAADSETIAQERDAPRVRAGLRLHKLHDCFERQVIEYPGDVDTAGGAEAVSRLSLGPVGHVQIHLRRAQRGEQPSAARRCQRAEHWAAQSVHLVVHEQAAMRSRNVRLLRDMLPVVLDPMFPGCLHTGTQHERCAPQSDLLNLVLGGSAIRLGHSRQLRLPVVSVRAKKMLGATR